MKVDKSVCTSNDAYFAGNTTANELNSIIKFETVFTTLVENKILAIKRECEQHENKKKSRTLKNILTKKNEAKNPDDGNQQQQEPINGQESKKKKNGKKNFFLRHKNKQFSDVDVERGDKRDNEALQVPTTGQAEIVRLEVQNDKVNNGQGKETKGDEAAKLDSQSNEHVRSSVDLTDSSNKLDGVQPNCDTLVANSQSENAQLTLSTNDSSNCHSNNTVKELSPPSAANDESLATTIDISLQQQSSVVAAVKSLSINNQPVKSDVAIYDDCVSSQNTSDIEFSLVSESISELPVCIRKKPSTNSDPVVKKPPHFLSPPLKREVKIIERKAISCHSTPLFGRHSKNEGDVKKVLTFQKELPKKSSDTKPIEKAKSQTIVIAPTSTTTTTTLAKPISTASGPVETVHLSRKSQKHSKYRDVSVEYEISYDDNEGNQSPRGFLSSFNQLTSQTPPVAVITSTNPKKQSLKEIKAQLTKEERTQHEIPVATADDKTAKQHEIELELDDLADDRKRRRRSKINGPRMGNSAYVKHLFPFDSRAKLSQLRSSHLSIFKWV